MKRELIETLFNSIYINFEAVRATAPTFRQLELDNMVVAGLSLTKAAEVYDRQVKKLNFLVRTLHQFPGDTPLELSNEAVIILLNALYKRIDSVLVIVKTNDNQPIIEAWSQTALRQANLSHAARNSFSAMYQFKKANDLKFNFEANILFTKIMTLEAPLKYGIGSYAKTSSLGGFITPAVQAPPATSPTNLKPPKITIRKS